MMVAFIIGFVGSLHCIGMCGPLMFTMMGSKKTLMTYGLYHLGRIGSYALLGLFLGWIGYSLHLFRIQQFFTITLGVFLLLIYGIPKARTKIEQLYYQSWFSRMIRNQLSKNLSSQNKWILSGMANGFLPCGLTYVAAAGAVVRPGYMQSVIFMLLFGLGTMPALATLTIGNRALSKRFKLLIPNTVSFIALLSGLLLILRGLLLTSPEFNQLIQTNAAALIPVCGL